MLKFPTSINYLSGSDIKCGEIFYQDFDNVSIICTFCELKTFNFEEFMEHLKNIHLENDQNDQDETCSVNELNSDKDEAGDNEEQFSKVIEFITESSLSDEEQLTDTNEHQSKHVMDKQKIYKGNDNDTDNDVNTQELEHLQNTDLENYLDEISSLNETMNRPDELKNDILEYINVEKFTKVIDFNSESSFSDEQLLTVVRKQKRKHKMKKRKIYKKHHDNNNEIVNNQELESEMSSTENLSETSLSKTKTLPKDQEFSCPDCQQIFPYVKDLTQHVNDCHNGYKCSQCDKRFHLPHHLKRHELTHQSYNHKGEKLYTCNGTDCMKIFTDPEVLKRHMEVHTFRALNFVCDFENCGKAFNSQNSLTSHKHAHKNKKKFVCDMCGFACRASTTLSIHLRTHTGEKPFPCELCEKHFISKSALKRHMLTHATTREYVCEICEATFTNNATLKRHRFIHSDKRPFQCKLCDKGFKQPHCLDAHIKYVHKETNHRTAFMQKNI
ncbi:uncharacterized protein ACRADG_008025 [Cochliomyia hominivorax]